MLGADVIGPHLYPIAQRWQSGAQDRRPKRHQPFDPVEVDEDQPPHGQAGTQPQKSPGPGAVQDAHDAQQYGLSGMKESNLDGHRAFIGNRRSRL